MSSSCCGGKCGCGSGCKCGSGCGGCKMNPDITSGETSTTQTLILGVAPNNTGAEKGGAGAAVAENGGCKCSLCTCESCSCK